MASLRDQQAAFAAALRDPAHAAAVTPPANLSVYRNNTGIVFRQALERAYPVVLRRVGADYFRQLAHFYREKFPSRSGDLQWIGREFAPFLARHLVGGNYAWLADLAALEWAREEAGIASELPVVGAESLGRFAAEELEHLTFTLQPSLRLVQSAFPVFSVWHANQAEDAPPVDQSKGEEHIMIRIRQESVEVQCVAPDVFLFVSALRAGATLGAAMTAANGDGPRLAEMLGFVFGAALVSSVTASGAAFEATGL
jgi:hypothetical protein